MVNRNSGISYQLRYYIYTPYAGAAEMLLQINGKLTVGKLKPSLLSFLTTPHCGFQGGALMYEAVDIAVSVVSFISSSIGQMTKNIFEYIWNSERALSI